MNNTNDRGFSLVELLIAMTLGLIVLGAVYGLFTVQSRHFSDQEQLTELHQNARVAMDIIVREISMAGYNPATGSGATIGAVNRCTGTNGIASNTPCVGITSAAADTISFVADINGNGDTTAGSANPNENIVYDVYSSSGIQALGRTSNGTKQPVVEYVQSLSFEYYDGAATPAPTAILADIRRVKITIVTRTAKEDPNYTDPTYQDHFRRYTLSAFAFPRNLVVTP